MKLGQKKLLVGAIAISGVLLFSAIKFAGEQTYKTDSSQETALKVFFSETTNKDSDADGLKDWEESLWKTSPTNPDTDGDGTPDGEEIALGRNPSLAGPNDKIKEGATENPDITLAAPGEELTLTDAFARSAFALYVAKKQQGQKIDENFANSLIDDFLTKNTSEGNEVVYTLSDIAVTSIYNQNSLRDYGNKVAQIITPDTPYSSADILNALLSAVQGGNKNSSAIVEGRVFMYEKMIRELLEIVVPSVITEKHVDLLNAVEALYEDITTMTKVQDDPIRALLYIRRYIYFSTINAVNAAVAVGKALASQGVVFQQSEDGYVLTPAL